MLSSSSVNSPEANPWYKRPKVLIAAVALLLAVVVLSDLGRPANAGDKKVDFNVFSKTVRSDMLSCNASVSDSITAFNEIQSKKSTDLVTAKRIVTQAQPNCSVAVNSDLLDMSTQTIPTTLAPFHLQRVLSDMESWAYPNAVQLIADINTALSTGMTPALASDIKIRAQAMNRAESEAQGVLNSTASKLSVHPAPQLGLDGLDNLPKSIAG